MSKQELETVKQAEETTNEKATQVASVSDAKKSKDNRFKNKNDKKNGKKDKKERKFGKRTKETFSELKKVTWPTFAVVCKRTGIVLAVVLIFALILFGMDMLLGWLTGLIR